MQIPCSSDPLYTRARTLLLQQPEMGKAKLAIALGVKTPDPASPMASG